MLGDYKIKFLKTVSKVSLTPAELNIFSSYITDKDVYSILPDIFNHKLQFLFFKHLKESGKFFCLNKKVNDLIGYNIAFLQMKYSSHIRMLKNLTSDFDSCNIEYSIIKGIALISDLYKNSNTIYRDFSDVDILIDKKNVTLAKEILKNNGFTQGFVNEEGILQQFSRSDQVFWSLNSHQECTHIKKGEFFNPYPFANYIVDLNTTIFEGGCKKVPISTEKILMHSVDKIIEKDVSVKCLDPVFGLLQLCYHFYKDTVYDSKKETHDNYCLIKFCDIREYINRYSDFIDWDKFVEITNDANIGNQVYYCLWLVLSFYDDLKIGDVLEKIKTAKLYFKNDLNWEEMLL